MTEELKRYLDELNEKEARLGGYYKRPLQVAFPDGSELKTFEAKKRFDLRLMDGFIEKQGLDSFKEMVVHELLRNLVEVLDEAGIIDFEAKAGLDHIEFKLSLSVLKNGSDESFESRGRGSDELRDWPL